MPWPERSVVFFLVYVLPNYVLAVVMYTLIGRLLLGFLLPEESKNYIMRAFVFLTNPAVTVTAFITPKMVPFRVVLIFAVIWVFLARILLLSAVSAAGLLPSIGGA